MFVFRIFATHARTRFLVTAPILSNVRMVTLSTATRSIPKIRQIFGSPVIQTVRATVLFVINYTTTKTITKQSQLSKVNGKENKYLRDITYSNFYPFTNEILRKPVKPAHLRMTNEKWEILRLPISAGRHSE